MFNTTSVINVYLMFTLILSFGLCPDLRLHKDGDLVMYMRVQRLKWAGHVVMMFDNRIPKQIVGECLGEGMTREDKVLKGAAKLLNTKNWLTAARHGGDGRKKTDQEEEEEEEEEEEAEEE